MAPKANKPAYEAGKYYMVELAQAVAVMPGVTLRPGATHRIEGALLASEAFAGKIIQAQQELLTQEPAMAGE